MCWIWKHFGSNNCHGQTALGTWVCPQRIMKVMLGMPTLSYNPHALAGTTKIENGIMPPPPRRAMCPARNRRRLNWPVPIARRGRGSAEVDLKTTFSYKNRLGRTGILSRVRPQPRMEVMRNSSPCAGSSLGNCCECVLIRICCYVN